MTTKLLILSVHDTNEKTSRDCKVFEWITIRSPVQNLMPMAQRIRYESPLPVHGNINGVLYTLGAIVSNLLTLPSKRPTVNI